MIALFLKPGKDSTKEKTIDRSHEYISAKMLTVY